MNKIVAAIDGLKFSESARDYSVHLAKQTKAHLVGVFLDDFTYNSYKVYELITERGVSTHRQRQLEGVDKAARLKAVKKFETACKAERLNYTIHHDRSIAIQELLHESIYADLVVVDWKETLTHFEEDIPTRFICWLLEEAQCPVLLVPQKYTPVKKVVMLYDGQPSSVYAIKNFNYVLPSLNGVTIEVLTVKGERQSLHLPDNPLMKEFMKRHFHDAAYKVVRGIPDKEIMKYLKKQDKGTMVVLGAYRRGVVSRWLKASLADTLMENLEIPLFVAHN
jgi:hypothetical protein